MPLGLFPREASDATALMPDEADASAPPTPGFFAGIGQGIGRGVGSGGVKLAQAMGAGSADLLGAMSPMPDFTTPSSVVELDPEQVALNQRVAQQRVIDALKVNPHVVGTAGQALHGVSEGLTQMLIGASTGAGPLAGAVAVGAGEGVSTSQELRLQGVDESTARLLGAGSALFAGAGALLPGGYGSTLATRIATGSAAMTAFGVANRTMMSHVLSQAGYAEQARAYAPLDGMAMMADAILGAGFGAVHHAFAPDVTDAARVVKDAEHVERAADRKSVV